MWTSRHHTQHEVVDVTKDVSDQSESPSDVNKLFDDSDSDSSDRSDRDAPIKKLRQERDLSAPRIWNGLCATHGTGEKEDGGFVQERSACH